MIGAVLLQVVLIFLNATFASAEIAVISMNDNRLAKLAQDGDKRALRLAALTRQPARFLATIQVAITLAGLLGSAFAAESFAGPLVARLAPLLPQVSPGVLKSGSVVLITLVLAYFNLVFGELVPKRIAMKKAETLALALSGLLYGVSRVFAPLVFLLTLSTNAMLRLFGIDPEEDEEQVSEEEIRMMVTAGNRQGILDAEESQIIENVFAFDDITAEQICTHRVDVICLDTEDGPEAWDAAIFGGRHTYYPVCEGSVDQIQGVLDTKAYFRLETKSRQAVMEKAVKKACLIPESMKANVLFRNMRTRGFYFAVVIDEYGGLSGIVTLRDLMEALVGDLREEEESPRPEDIAQLDENRWVICGGADIDDVSRALGVPLPSDSCDTFGGYICGVLDEIPEDGAAPLVETEELIIKVHSVQGHRIGRATVEKRSKGVCQDPCKDAEAAVFDTSAATADFPA